MKKREILALFIALICFPGFALHDSLRYCTEGASWCNFVRAAKEACPIEKVEMLYHEFTEQSSGFISYRADFHLLKYYVDNDYRDKAEAFLETYRDRYGKLRDLSDYEMLVAKYELTSAEYYFSNKISVGMENSDLCKKLYSEYPEEVTAIIAEAFRLIYTPGFIGGSNQKALDILQKIEEEPDVVSDSDKFDYYVASALALNQQKKFNESNQDLDNADTIYSSYCLVNEIRAANQKEKKLRIAVL